MPYFQREWNEMDDKQNVNLIRNALNQQVEQLLKTSAAETLKGENNFLNYIIRKDQVLFAGLYSKIYPCFNHQEVIESALMCRIFLPNSKITPNDIYLKILRFIGRRSPNIIATMDIFYDEANQIYLFQEYAQRGNLLEYLRSGNYVEQKQMVQWANSIWQAMDFLGDCSIVHCNIRPKHILLKPTVNGELVAKLSGFRDAMIYWDKSRNDIIDVPKRQWNDIRFATFQAPETYSKVTNETFNPIIADVWSFGATFLYILTRIYPFDVTNCEDLTQIEDAIKHRVMSALSMSNEAKNWFKNLLQIDIKKRTKFNDIVNDTWFRSELQ